MTRLIPKLRAVVGALLTLSMLLLLKPVPAHATSEVYCVDIGLIEQCCNGTHFGVTFFDYVGKTPPNNPDWDVTATWNTTTHTWNITGHQTVNGVLVCTPPAGSVFCCGGKKKFTDTF